MTRRSKVGLGALACDSSQARVLLKPLAQKDSFKALQFSGMARFTSFTPERQAPKITRPFFP
jgi:hypothetical protein